MGLRIKPGCGYRGDTPHPKRKIVPVGTSVPATRATTLVDTASLFHAGAAIAAEFGGEKRLAPRYDALRRCLEKFRTDAGWPKANVSLALAAIDRSNLQQQRFIEALQRAGFAVWTRSTSAMFPSPPPSISRSEQEGHPAPSFAARIAYIAGLLARHSEGSLLVVTHSFVIASSPRSEPPPQRRLRRVPTSAVCSNIRWQRLPIVQSGWEKKAVRFLRSRSLQRRDIWC